MNRQTNGDYEEASPILARNMLLKLDKDASITITFNESGYTKLNDIQAECSWFMSPSKWIRRNKNWLKSLLPPEQYVAPYYTHLLGKDRGTYAVDKLALAYVADNDNHWKKTMLEMLYCNSAMGNLRGSTYFSDELIISSEMTSWCNQALNNFNQTIYAADPVLSQQLRARFIQWLTGNNNPDVGEGMILSGQVPGIHMYCKLLNKAVLCFQLVPTYEGICHLLELGG